MTHPVAPLFLPPDSFPSIHLPDLLSPVCLSHRLVNLIISQGNRGDDETQSTLQTAGGLREDQATSQTLHPYRRVPGLQLYR